MRAAVRMLGGLPGLVVLTLVLAFSPAFAQESGLHKLAGPQLAQLKGQYPADRPAANLLTPPLRALLGKRYAEFDEYITVQTPIEVEQGVTICAGMQPRSGGDNAAFAFFQEGGRLLVVIKTGQKFEYFGSRSLASLPAVAKALKRYS